MSFSSSSSSQQQLRARRPQPPPLPEPLSLEIDGKAIIKYIDIKPASYTSSTPTIALIHGSPGTYQDFRYLVPLLQKNARVVALNLPGHADSEVIDKANHFEHVSSTGASKIAFEALGRICKDAKNMFLVGHSFGGHTVTNLAAFNLQQPKLRIRGLVMLNSAGHRPHHALWPMTATVVIGIARTNLPIISTAAASFVHMMYTKVVGFPNSGPPSHFMSALVRSNTADYDLVNKQRKEIAHIPAFVAWAKNDPHIEEELSLVLSDEFHPGPRFAFDKGGHNIQKAQADVLAVEIMRWIEAIVADNQAGVVAEHAEYMAENEEQSQEANHTWVSKM